jgi:hypothetical protein
LPLRAPGFGRCPIVIGNSVSRPSRMNMNLLVEPGVGDRLAIDLKEDVAREHACLVGRTASHHPCDDRAVLARQLEGLRQFGRDILRLDADIAPHYAAVANDLVHHAASGRGRDCKADAERSAGT